MGGRKKGSPNKNTLPLAERASALGVDPFEILLLFAKGDWEALGYEYEFETKIGAGGAAVESRIINTDHRIAAAKAVCEYLHPKRKAVEHSGPNGEPIAVKDAATPEERKARLKTLITVLQTLEADETDQED